MSKRIIPISSGKGGVGKTSFAVNLSLALSQYGKTILVDLDTSTSSLRNTIKTPIRRDLYHFFKKGDPLATCITPLSSRLDPLNRYSNLGLIASPKHYIDAIANMDQAARNRLIDAINGLQADYIVLDLKAGLDPLVMDFLPHANTGILVFTPHHPAATLAASDIAKAILFRELRDLFHRGSLVYEHFKKVDPEEVNFLIDLAEDPYDMTIPNLDVFLTTLADSLSDAPFLNILDHIVRTFQVYFVLNRFDGVESSYDSAIKPLVRNIHENLSGRVGLNNLGWIIESKAYNEANYKRIPYLLAQHNRKEAGRKRDMVESQMEELYALAGMKPRRRGEPIKRKIDSQEMLQGQLTALEAMYKLKKDEDIVQNFDYITSCIGYLFHKTKLSGFGTPRILKKGELVNLLLKRKQKP